MSEKKPLTPAQQEETETAVSGKHFAESEPEDTSPKKKKSANKTPKNQQKPKKHLAAKLFGIGIPAAAAVVTIVALCMTVAQRNRTIDSLEAQMTERNIPILDTDSFTYEQKEYMPIDVHHYYERLGYKIYLSDDTFGQIWLPVLSDVARSTHPQEQLIQQRDGRMLSFGDNGNLNAMTGIDISAHNQITDWDAIKADGIDFVMLRVGYRGYGVGTGTLQTDDRFREYYQAAKNAGLLVGAYFFSQAINEEEAVEEAMLTVQQLEGCELDFPVAYDWELIYHDSEARTDNVPVDVLTDCVIAYCQNVESYGYQAMYYQNKRTSLFKLDLPRLQEIPFWLAEYGDGPTYIYDYQMWQYCCDGTVDGIIGDVDINLCFFDYSQEGAPAVDLPVPEGASREPVEIIETTDTTETTETTETTDTEFIPDELSE